jgi:hypothetical protein
MYQLDTQESKICCEAKSNEGSEDMSTSKKQDVGRGKQVASTKPGMRIQAVRRAKPDVQRLAQALIEIAISQAEVVVDETDDLNEPTKAAS